MLVRAGLERGNFFAFFVGSAAKQTAAMFRLSNEIVYGK
jgi:hypothetical protein